MYVTFQKRTRSIVDKVGGWIFTRKRCDGRKTKSDVADAVVVDVVARGKGD